ncbi:MAG TPA: helical backbone metal receptor [Thermoanaerobaculia bacterium]|nr:helical backbone metal receptor [Thermoanaerobaculia bacterium]
MLGIVGVTTAACRPARQEPAAAAPAAALPAPRRIVSMAPNLTETSYALGLGGRVVGVDDFSVWPAEVAGKARLGGLFNPNLERIVAVRPDLALLLPSERDVAAKLERLGIATLIVPSETLADIERSFSLIARRCGVAAAGESLARRWRAELASRPLRGSPRVMLCLARQAGRLSGLLAAGPGTFLDDLLRRLGAVNAFADAPSAYPQVGLEEVAARAPDAIVELTSAPLSAAEAAALVGDWRQLPSVPAVRNGRISVIAGDFVTIPGPRLPLLYRRLREALSAPPPPAGEVR